MGRGITDEMKVMFVNKIKEKYLKRVAETFPKWESFLCYNIEMIQPKLANVKIKKNHKDHECTM